MKAGTIAIILLMITTYLFLWSACVPALPLMSIYYQNHNATSLVVILYLLGLGISQIFYGPLSDIFGRKPLILIGGCVMLLGSMIIMTFASFKIILIGRLIQGIGAGCFSTIGKSIARDISNKDSFVKIVSMMMLAAVVMQIISPIIGGYIVTYFSWKFVFYAMSLYGMIALILISLFLPETNKNKTEKKNLKKTTKRHLQLIKEDKRFWYFAVISALTLTNITIFQISSPFVLQQQIGLTPLIFGWTPAFNASGFIIGNLTAIKINLHRITIIFYGLILMTLGASLMLLMSNINIMLAVTIPMFIYSLGTGIVLPQSTAHALMNHKKSIGFASSCIGSIQMLTAAIISKTVTIWGIFSQHKMALCILIITTTTLSVFLLSRNQLYSRFKNHET